ncbi:MAG TPA: DUF4405 domain-containing protein [bacterium]|nr:DUF4405 domain-containing protein [bacterium]
MDKNRINYTLDILMAVAALVVATTGLIIFFFLPTGQWRGGWQEFLGIPKRILVDWHNWSGIILLFLIVIHFFLHWPWLIATTKNLFRTKNQS